MAYEATHQITRGRMPREGDVHQAGQFHKVMTVQTYTLDDIEYKTNETNDTGRRHAKDQRQLTEALSLATAAHPCNSSYRSTCVFLVRLASLSVPLVSCEIVAV